MSVAHCPLLTVLLLRGEKKAGFFPIWDTARKQASKKLNIDEWSVPLDTARCCFSVESLEIKGLCFWEAFAALN